MMKVTETHGGKMYLETQDGLDFALRIFHSSFISIYWSSRTDDSKQPLPDGLRGTSQGERHPCFTGL